MLSRGVTVHIRTGYFQNGSFGSVWSVFRKCKNIYHCSCGTVFECVKLSLKRSFPPTTYRNFPHTGDFYDTLVNYSAISLWYVYV